MSLSALSSLVSKQRPSTTHSNTQHSSPGFFKRRVPSTCTLFTLNSTPQKVPIRPGVQTAALNQPEGAGFLNSHAFYQSKCLVLISPGWKVNEWYPKRIPQKVLPSRVDRVSWGVRSPCCLKTLGSCSAGSPPPVSILLSHAIPW